MRTRLGRAVRRAEKAEAATRKPVTAQDADLTRQIGDEVTEVLDAARAAGQQRIATAERSAASLLSNARTEADSMRKAAQSVLQEREAEANKAREAILAEARKEAETLRNQAIADVDEARIYAGKVITRAKREGDALIEEASEARAQILEDMERRRRQARAQVERLRVGRNRLLRSYDVVRRTLEESTIELKSSLAEAKVSGDNAARLVLAAEEASRAQLEAEMADAKVVGLYQRRQGSDQVVSDTPDSSKAATPDKSSGPKNLAPAKPSSRRDGEAEAKRTSSRTGTSNPTAAKANGPATPTRRGQSRPSPTPSVAIPSAGVKNPPKKRGEAAPELTALEAPAPTTPTADVSDLAERRRSHAAESAATPERPRDLTVVTDSVDIPQADPRPAAAQQAAAKQTAVADGTVDSEPGTDPEAAGPVVDAAVVEAPLDEVPAADMGAADASPTAESGAPSQTGEPGTAAGTEAGTAVTGTTATGTAVTGTAVTGTAAKPEIAPGGTAEAGTATGGAAPTGTTASDNAKAGTTKSQRPEPSIPQNPQIIRSRTETGSSDSAKGDGADRQTQPEDGERTPLGDGAAFRGRVGPRPRRPKVGPTPKRPAVPKPPSIAPTIKAIEDKAEQLADDVVSPVGDAVSPGGDVVSPGGDVVSPKNDVNGGVAELAVADSVLESKSQSIDSVTGANEAEAAEETVEESGDEIELVGGELSVIDDEPELDAPDAAEPAGELAHDDAADDVLLEELATLSDEELRLWFSQRLPDSEMTAIEPSDEIELVTALNSDADQDVMESETTTVMASAEPEPAEAIAASPAETIAIGAATSAAADSAVAPSAIAEQSEADLATVVELDDVEVGLFAALRSKKAEPVEPAKSVTRPEPASPESADLFEALDAQSAMIDAEAARLDERDELWLSEASALKRSRIEQKLSERLERRLKRVLADEQNVLLVGLANAESTMELIGLVGDADHHLNRYVTAITQDAWEAFVATAEVAGETVEPGRLPAGAVEEMLLEAVIDPIRHRLNDLGGRDQKDCVEAVRVFYRQRKTESVPQVATDLAALVCNSCVCHLGLEINPEIAEAETV